MKNHEDLHSIKSAQVLEETYFPKVLKARELDKNCKILDIGCASGYFLRLCDLVGCDTYGLDISEQAISQARIITRAKLYVHDVSKGLPMFDDDTFELVTMFDIIEHLDSPLFMLREVNRVLKANGRMVITTPNINAIGRLIWKSLGRESKWYGFIDKTHKNLYTLSSLEHLLEEAKLKALKRETPFHPAPKILQKLINRTGLGGQIWLVGAKNDSRFEDVHSNTRIERDGEVAEVTRW